MSSLIPFKKLNNVRDLGGMKTANGRLIRSGSLIRSGHLSGLIPEDVDSLKVLVDRVIDFRTPQEREENPDTIVEGIEYTCMPVLDTLTEGLTREKEADKKVFLQYLTRPREAAGYMSRMYQSFAQDYALSQYAQFLKLLKAGSRKAILWHCTAGKDRAGIASALIEEILGVPREEIIADYLATNEYLKRELSFLSGFVKKQAGIEDGAENQLAEEAIRNLFKARKEYIESFYGEVDRRYGSFRRMTKDALGLNADDISLLREKYLT